MMQHISASNPQGRQSGAGLETGLDLFTIISLFLIVITFLFAFPADAESIHVTTEQLVTMVDVVSDDRPGQAVPIPANADVLLALTDGSREVLKLANEEGVSFPCSQQLQLRDYSALVSCLSGTPQFSKSRLESRDIHIVIDKSVSAELKATVVEFFHSVADKVHLAFGDAP